MSTLSEFKAEHPEMVADIEDLFPDDTHIADVILMRLKLWYEED